MTNQIATDDPRALAMLDAYRLFFNFYADPDQTYATLDAFIADPDIAATIDIRSIDFSENAIHIYFDLDTCPINLIAFFEFIPNTDRAHMNSILLSTDTMTFEPMICDRTRRLDYLNH